MAIHPLAEKIFHARRYPIGDSHSLADGSDQNSNDILFFNPKEESFVPLGFPFPNDKPVKNRSETWHYKNDIYVFDWDGNPDDKYLYASVEPEENEDITLWFKL